MKKTTIILIIVIVAVLAGIFLMKSQDNPVANTSTPTTSATPSPSPYPEVEEDFGGKILSLNSEKIVIQDKDGNVIDVLINNQVKYYDKGVMGGRDRKEITFASFHVGDWIGVRGWTSDDPTKPARTVRATS